MSTFYINAVKTHIQAALDDKWDMYEYMDSANGICVLVDTACLDADYDTCDDISDALKRCFEAWPNFSGSLMYPVPAPLGWEPLTSGFDASDFPRLAYQQIADIWTGVYGELRRELAEFVMCNLESEFNEGVEA